MTMLESPLLRLVLAYSVVLASAACSAVVAPEAAVPASTRSSAPTPNPSQSAIVAKCKVRLFIGAPRAGMVDFDRDVDQEITVGAGQRILLGGIDEALCQRFVTFNGRPRSALLKPTNDIGTGSDRLRAVGLGTVEVAAFQPMCATIADAGCYGGVIPLGTIIVTVVPREPPPPVVGRCTPDQLSVRAESEPGTAEQQLWLTVRLLDAVGCRLIGTAAIEIRNKSGALLSMPYNPRLAAIRTKLRPGKPVVIRWGWQMPFCRDGSPYSGTLSIIGLDSEVSDVNSPDCPTFWGGKRKPPAGLRFNGLLTLR